MNTTTGGSLMNLEIETFGETKVMRIKEDTLSYPMLGVFFDKAYALIESGARDLVINLAEVRYLDSASLGCLMDISRNMTRYGGTIKLVGLRDRVQSVATMVGLTNHIEAFAEEETALEHVVV
jgi:anti-anti-sigma factor